MKVSIIGTLHNQWESAERALHIWLRQKGAPPYELILLDDNSTDNSEEEVLKLQKQFPGMIKYYYFERPKPRAYSLLMNYGAKIATGDVLIMQFYDRIPDSFYVIRDLLKPFVERPKWTLSSTQCWCIGTKSSVETIPVEKLRELLDKVPWREDPSTLCALSYHKVAANKSESTCFAIKKSDFIEIGGYNEKYTTVAGTMNLDFLHRCRLANFHEVWIQAGVHHQPHSTPGDRQRIPGIWQQFPFDGEVEKNVSKTWGEQTPIRSHDGT